MVLENELSFLTEDELRTSLDTGKSFFGPSSAGRAHKVILEISFATEGRRLYVWNPQGNSYTTKQYSQLGIVPEHVLSQFLPEKKFYGTVTLGEDHEIMSIRSGETELYRNKRLS